MSNRFGGEWTVKKLECVKRYLDRYVKVMKKQYHFATHYIDAFAGTGYVDLRKAEPDERTLLDELEEAEADANSFLDGSAVLSLDVDPSFDNYHFIEKSPTRAASLQLIKFTRLDLLDRINVINGDANEYIQRICGRWPHDHRGVVFLDPYGMQVEWETLCAIARTERLDMWYLVAISAINRLLPQEGFTGQKWQEKWQPALKRMFGTDEWVDEFYRPVKHNDLFGSVEDVERVVNWERLCGFVLKRLRSLFDAVAPDPLLLCNSRGAPQFLLCFAMNSRSDEAKRIALDIADHILRNV